jgi:Xaa-Pro aminopeptidase
MVLLRIPKQEHLQRINSIKEELKRRKLDALYLSNPFRVSYVTGFPFIACSRPFGLLIPKNDELVLIIPKLEQTHLKERGAVGVSEVVTYFEYPGKQDPLDVIAATFRRRKVDKKKIGFDSSALPDLPGYEGGSLSKKLPDATFIAARDIIDRMRSRKSTSEIELFKEAARWGNLAHTYLQEFIEVGRSEIEISSKATYHATSAMLKSLGPSYEPLELIWYPAWARFKAGHRTAYTHGLLVNRRVRLHDPIETAAEGMVGGYGNHLERTMYVGKPDNKFRRYFSIMLKMQNAAIATCKPGVKCEEVHRNVVRVVKHAGLNPKTVIHHRSGHGMGLEHFEPPFFVEGDQTTLAPGMVFTIEPGLYVDGYAGFRHCDTVVITEDGCEIIDYYPRELEDLIVTGK